MKYLLAIIMMTSLISCNGGGDAAPNKTDGVVNPNSTGNTNNPAISRKPEFTSVTTEYGELEVKAGIHTSQSDIIPWSSWWYPNNRRTMFDLEGKALSPLEKYDAFVANNFDSPSYAALYEEEEIYDRAEVAWSGLCHAWAIASVLYPEPRTSITRDDITFTPTDQKALLLKTYENVSGLKIYGQRNDGQHGQEYDDVYPDQFHKFIQVFLFDKKLPFLMDYDASFPVWTVPVYLARFEVIYESENSAVVKTWLTMASPFVDADSFSGTKSIAKSYEYRLFGKWKEGVLKVTHSEWIKDSKYDHPDYLIPYPADAKRATLNKELKIENIDLILKKKK